MNIWIQQMRSTKLSKQTKININILLQLISNYLNIIMRRSEGQQTPNPTTINEKTPINNTNQGTVLIQQPRDSQGRPVSQGIIELTNQIQRTSNPPQNANFVQQSSENISRGDQRSSNDIGGLAQSQLIHMPVQQTRPQSQPAYHSLSPPFYPQVQVTGQFLPNYIQPPTYYVNSNQYPQGYTQNQFVRQQPLIMQMPNQQFAPNWINQPQTTQARIQQQNGPQYFVNNTIENIPSVNQSQRVIVQNQIQERRTAIGPRFIQQRSPSSSPPKINFNYHFGQGIQQVRPSNFINVPQPQIRPSQPVPLPPPQIIPIPPPNTVPPPQTISVPPPQTVIVPIPQQQQQTVINHQIIWEQRYFLIIQKFQFYYTRFDIITHQYYELHHKIEQTHTAEQLGLLKQQANRLLVIIAETQQELTQTIYQNKQIIGEATNWKVKYDQLLAKFNSLSQKSNQGQIAEDLANKLSQLEKKFSDAQKENHQLASLNKDITQRYNQAQDQMQFLKNQLQQSGNKVQALISSNNNSNNSFYQQKIIQFSSQLKAKEEQISNLQKMIPSNSNTASLTNKVAILQSQINRLNQQLQQNHGLIGQLRSQNQSLYLDIKKFSQEHQQYVSQIESRINSYEEDIAKKRVQINDYRISFEQKTKLIETLTVKLNSTQTTTTTINQSLTQSQSVELQSQVRRLNRIIKVKQDNEESDHQIYSVKMQQLVDRIKMMSNQKQSYSNTMQQKVNLLQSDLTRKDGTIRNLRDRILELQQEKRINDIDSKYNTKKNADANISDSNEVNSIKRQLSEKVNQIQQLQAQILEYKRISNQYEDSLSVKKHQINNLKRQLDGSFNSSEEISKLNQILNRRNAEVIDLKNKVFELEKVTSQNQLLRQETLSLNQSIKRKHGQLAETTDKIYLLQRKIRQLESSKDSSPQIAHLSEELGLLQVAIKKKDIQIVKLRQSNQLLETNVQQLQAELGKIKSKLTSGQKLSQSEKCDLKSKLTIYESKINQYERKIGGLEEVRNILQEQVTTLTTEVHIKFETLQKNQLELKQEKIKAKAFETEAEALLIEVEQLKNKLKQQQRKNANLVKQMQAEVDKKKELTNTKKNELFNLNNKYIDMENACKNKDNRIKQLQKTIESQNYKMRNQDNNLQQIQYLKSKINQYEVKLTSFNFNRPITRVPELQPTQVFQKKIIYQLKLENQSLKKQLGLSQVKNKRPNSQSDVPQRDNSNKQNVQQRLNDFNSKLESILSEQFNGQLPLNTVNNQMFKKYERDRRQLIEKHNQEISQLKVKILQLQDSGIRINFNGNKQSKKYGSVEGVYTQQLQFYREKNQQLEERVDNHIRVNKQLKESIELLMRGHSEQYSIQYYKEQIQKSNDVITVLQGKLKRANEQIKKLKDDLAKGGVRVSTDINNYEYESKITQLNRKISQLSLQINLSEKDKVSRIEQLEEKDIQIKKLKIQIDQLRVWKQQNIRLFKQKQTNLQDELVKLSNKLRIHQSEIERLNEMLNKRQGQQSGQLKNLKQRLAQSQEEGKRYRQKLQQLIINEERYQRQISKFEGQVSLLSSQIQRLMQLVETANRKQKQYETQLQNMKIIVTQYESKLRQRDASSGQFTYKQSQYQQQISRLNNQIKMLQSQIERINQFGQKKITQKDGQINRLKVVITERNNTIASMEEQISQLKIISFRNNEAAQQIFNLKEQINKLRIALISKTTQSENRLKQITELNSTKKYLDDQLKELRKTFDSKVLQLNRIITELQEQNKEIKKTSESKIYQQTSKIRILEQQISEMRRSGDGKYSEINSAYLKIQEQLREAQSRIMELVTTKKALQSQLRDVRQSSQAEINKMHLHIINLQAHLQQLEAHLQQITTSGEGKIYELNHTIYQLQEEIKQLRAFSETKIYELTQIIQSLQIQLEELHRLREGQIQQFTVTIRNLQIQLAELNKTKGNSQALEDQLRELRRIKDLQISELRRVKDIEIVKLKQLREYDLNELRKVRDLEYAELKRVKDLQINELKVTISRLQQKLLGLGTNKDGQIIELKTTILSLQNELKQINISWENRFALFILSSRYTIEFVRSTLIEIDVLMGEDSIPFEFLSKKVSQEIDKSLQECRKWNESV